MTAVSIAKTSLKHESSWQGVRRSLGDSPAVGPLITLVLVLILSALFIPNFATLRTASGIINAATVTGVVTIGITLLMISGEFDLSVGAMVAVGSYLFAFGTLGEEPMVVTYVLMATAGILALLACYYSLFGTIRRRSTRLALSLALIVGIGVAAGIYFSIGNLLLNTLTGGSPVIAILLALLVPGLLGTLNGLLRVGTGINSFIVTLGTSSIFRAVVWIIAAGRLIQTQAQVPIYYIFNGRLDVINNLFERANFRTALIWLLLLVTLFEILLMRSRFGNHIFATGGNAGAATAQGVNVKLTRVLTFTLVGVLAGFAGMLDFSQFHSVRIATGEGVELSAIAAAVIGGTRLQGGSGSIWGALIGVLLVSTLRTSAVLLGLPPDNFEAIVGVCIIGAVILNNWLRQRF